MSDKVTLKEKVSYALVNLGNIPIQTILGSYLLIFYTNVVGLSPAACATLFLIARIMDGLNDPFVGFAIDHMPTTKHGHFRPTLIIGTVLCSINFLLLWFGPLMATSGKLVIAYITYLLIGVLFPVMDISLNSMLPVMTTDMGERNTLSSLKGFVYMLGMFGLNMIAPIIIGNTSEKEGYIRLILILDCRHIGTERESPGRPDQEQIWAEGPGEDFGTAPGGNHVFKFSGIYDWNVCHEYDAGIFLYLCNRKPGINQCRVHRAAGGTASGNHPCGNIDCEVRKEETVHCRTGFNRLGSANSLD